jgi:hypothetical protein
MMYNLWRRLLLWVASLVLTAVCICPAGQAFAQPPGGVPGQKFDSEGKPVERAPPAMQYSIAALSLILIMCILSIPSRKRTIGKD